MTAADKARALQSQLKAKMDRLQEIDPNLIDLSLRENPVGSRLGQTSGCAMPAATSRPRRRC